MKFSKDNQPTNRGRKPTGQKPTIRVSVNQETKDYFSKRKGLAGKVLEEYKQSNENLVFSFLFRIFAPKFNTI